MPILIEGIEKRIGLALSGGGFRAAAFHLGVFEKLKSLNLLDKIDLLTCVSGGSIAGGYLALNWNKPSVLSEIETYLKTQSIAVSSFLAGLLDPFETRLEKLADTYDDGLFNKKTLEDLKSGPRIYFNSTNLATGNMFSFVTGGNGPSEMGDWELGYVNVKEFPISKAVAASSAFPPVFPPLVIGKGQYPSMDVEYVSLSDGGVYDNLGVNPLFRDRNNLDYAIVSDGGKPFEIDQTPTEKGTIVLKESLGIMMEQIRGLQFDRLMHRHTSNEGPKPLWFSIDSEVKQNKGDHRFASSIGTNLKKLDEYEMEVLKRHGGALVESRIKKYAPELL